MDKLIPVEIEAATELCSVPIEQFTEFEAAYEMTGGIVPTGEIEITQNGQYDVTQYASADVNVQGGVTPTGTINITSNGTVDVTNYAAADVDVQPTLQSKSATPTTSSQTIQPDVGYDGLSSVSVGAIPGEYIIPSGTKTITTNGTHDVTSYASTSVNVQGGITPTGTKQITIDSSGTTTEDVTNYASVEVNVPSGSASTPTTSITANPSISVSNSGLITASASASQSVTPTVSEGWVSSGSAGTVSVSGSNTSQLSTQGATTITPTTSQQTAVASGKYTTGNVVVDPIPSQYIIPSGTKSITANGTGIDVTQYASVDVNVSGGVSSLYSMGGIFAHSNYTDPTYSVEINHNHVTVHHYKSMTSGITTSLRLLGTNVNFPTQFTINNGSTVNVKVSNVVNASNLSWNMNGKLANSTTSLSYGIGNGTHASGENQTFTATSTQNVGCWFLYVDTRTNQGVTPPTTLEFDMELWIDGVRYL